MPYRASAPIAQFNNQQLKGQIAQSAATYAEEQILLPQVPEGILPALMRVTIQLDLAQYLDAAGEYQGFHLSPKQQTVLLKIGDPDCICAKFLECIGIDTTHQFQEIVYEFPAPQLISYRSIWIGVKGTKAQTIDYCIDWVPRNASVPQRDNLVSQAQF